MIPCFCFIFKLFYDVIEWYFLLLSFHSKKQILICIRYLLIRSVSLKIPISNEFNMVLFDPGFHFITYHGFKIFRSDHREGGNFK